MLLHAGIMAVILLGSAADFLYKGQIIFAGQILGYKGLPENFHAPRLTSPTGRVNSGHNNSIFMCTNFTLIFRSGRFLRLSLRNLHAVTSH